MTTDLVSTAPPLQLSRRWHYAREQAISFLMQQAVENPEVISLAAGLVDYSTLPGEETLDASQEVLSDHAAAQIALQYGTTAGAERLRRLLLNHFAELEGQSAADCPAETSRLMITTGSQQLLSLACEVLLDPGDICVVAGPTYFVFCGNLNGVGAETVTIPTDDDGIRTDLLEAELQRLDSEGLLPRVKLIYVVSYYDNPAGLSLSLDRRREVVEIARRWSREHRILILEDAAYRELRYDGPVFPSIWSCDDTGGQNVIYTQTFSKSYAPGLRVGFGVVPDDLVRPLCDRKGNEDFGSANLNQYLLANVLESGRYAEHLQLVCDSYRTKRDKMLAAAEEHFSGFPGAMWVHPHGGLYVWMTLPEQIETGFESALFEEAVKRQGVMYVPGELCYTGPIANRPRHQMRLSYGVQTPDGIEEGMRRLAAAVQTFL